MVIAVVVAEAVVAPAAVQVLEFCVAVTSNLTVPGSVPAVKDTEAIPPSVVFVTEFPGATTTPSSLIPAGPAIFVNVILSDQSTPIGDPDAPLTDASILIESLPPGLSTVR